jgi:hypothetical protein
LGLVCACFDCAWYQIFRMTCLAASCCITRLQVQLKQSKRLKGNFRTASLRFEKVPKRNNQLPCQKNFRIKARKESLRYIWTLSRKSNNL